MTRLTRSQTSNLFLLFAALWYCAGPALAEDLSGMWVDPGGGVFSVSQKGNEVTWIGQGMVKGKFFIHQGRGTVTGNGVQATWQNFEGSEAKPDRGNLAGTLTAGGKSLEWKGGAPYTSWARDDGTGRVGLDDTGGNSGNGQQDDGGVTTLIDLIDPDPNGEADTEGGEGAEGGGLDTLVTLIDAGTPAQETPESILSSGRPWEHARVRELIDEWLRIATPAIKPVRKTVWRYEEWGRAWNGLTVVRPVQAPSVKQTRYEYLWHTSPRLPSVRHCTLRVYIERRLKGEEGTCPEVQFADDGEEGGDGDGGEQAKPFNHDSFLGRWEGEGPRKWRKNQQTIKIEAEISKHGKEYHFWMLRTILGGSVGVQSSRRGRLLRDEERILKTEKSSQTRMDLPGAGRPRGGGRKGRTPTQRVEVHETLAFRWLEPEKIRFEETEVLQGEKTGRLQDQEAQASVKLRRAGDAERVTRPTRLAGHTYSATENRLKWMALSVDLAAGRFQGELFILYENAYIWEAKDRGDDQYVGRFSGAYSGDEYSGTFQGNLDLTNIQVNEAGRRTREQTRHSLAGTLKENGKPYIGVTPRLPRLSSLYIQKLSRPTAELGSRQLQRLWDSVIRTSRLSLDSTTRGLASDQKRLQDARAKGRKTTTEEIWVRRRERVLAAWKTFIPRCEQWKASGLRKLSAADYASLPRGNAESDPEFHSRPWCRLLRFYGLCAPPPKPKAKH